MPSALVAYATTHGQTGKIAARIAATLDREGVVAHLREVEDGAGTDPLEFDGIVVAGSIHIGKHQRRLVDVHRRIPRGDRLPSTGPWRSPAPCSTWSTTSSPGP